MKNFCLKKTFSLYVVAALIVLSGSSYAVTSEIVRHSTAADLLAGETENAVIDSEGTVKLARQSTEIDCNQISDDIWVINTVVAAPDGSIYLGTSPNGDIIKYSLGKLTKIYPPHQAQPEEHYSRLKSNNDPNDPNLADTELFSNEHVYAMALDSTGRLLAALSGDDPRLMRLDKGQFETIYQPTDPNSVRYIFSIALDDMGNIYLGTGPEGKVLQLNPSCTTDTPPQLVYDCADNSILSMTIDNEGFIYAGSDQRGLIYKINPDKQTATVLYDSEQTEITAILFDDRQNLYVSATSAKAVKDHDLFSGISADLSAGKPDIESPSNDLSNNADDSTTLKIANTGKAKDSQKSIIAARMEKSTVPKSASHIYKIDPRGFVTDIFSEMAVFFAMASQNGKLLLGTGNDAQLFSIDPETEKKSVAYEDKHASQISALAVTDDMVYIGTANPAKLIKLAKSFAEEGSYTSDLVDASQPAKWGKLQIDADIPTGCQVLMSARSGNLKDPDDKSFSPWTDPIQVTDATQLNCPTGRFCQYKLTLKSSDPTKTPLVREVAIAHVVPNLPPKIKSIKLTRSEDNKKPHIIKITYTAKDDNNDKLIYKLEFRKVGRTRWIKLKDKLTENKFDWNSKTVEDGRYEIRVTASDKKNNTETTKLTGSRISDPFVVDNTAPTIETVTGREKKHTVTVRLKVKDEFSAIGNVSYTIDSNEDWISTLPNDLVYDTTSEDFKIVLEDLDPGEHVIALKITDDLNNAMYKTFEVNTEDDKLMPKEK